MSDPLLMTAEQFAQTKFDLPDGGRWSELVAGEVCTFQPPDDAHGTFVLNVSKALGEYVHAHGDAVTGCACYELGLIVARRPDTVRCPAVSFFTGERAFAESDKVVTETRPALIVDATSTRDRWQRMKDRLDEFLAWGVPLVWVADTAARRLHVFQPDAPHRRLSEADTLTGDPVLAGFSIAVADLFAVPAWWSGPRQPRGTSAPPETDG